MLGWIEIIVVSVLIVCGIVLLLCADNSMTMFLKFMCKIGLSKPTHTWKDVD